MWALILIPLSLNSVPIWASNSNEDVYTDLFDEKLRIVEWAVGEGLGGPIERKAEDPELAIEKIDFSSLRKWEENCKKDSTREEEYDQGCLQVINEAYKSVADLSMEHLMAYLEYKVKAKDAHDEL